MKAIVIVIYMVTYRQNKDIEEYELDGNITIPNCRFTPCKYTP